MNDKPLSDAASGPGSALQAALSDSIPIAEAPAGVVISAYRLGSMLNAVRIERAQQIDGPDLWAVRRHGDVLNRNSAWEWEPMPSSRDDEFLARCRFATHIEAIDAARAATKEKPDA